MCYSPERPETRGRPVRHSGYKINFKTWFLIKILRRDLQLNWVAKYNPVNITDRRLIVNLIKANIPEKSVITFDVNAADLTVIVRVMWFSRSNDEGSLLVGAEMEGLRCKTLGNMIDETNG